ncbi:unnamed protein product [Malus baccata var. baccata]
MRPTIFVHFVVGISVCLSSFCTINGILINGQFPGPNIEAVTNDNVIINVINKLDEPFLITWNGIKQRKTTWQDGVLGTQCPIPPNTNWTYKFQTKDQIGTFSYFPSTKLHRAAGGFGGFNVAHRSVIAVPYPIPAGEFTLLVGDWYKTGHKELQQTLDSGKNLPLPDGLLINGVLKNAVFIGEKEKTYKFRVSNVGIATSINFRIQSHTMTLVEVEGAHTLQEVYESLDIHPGQTVAVLVTPHGSVRDYFIVASTRFTKPILTTTGILRYAGSNTPALKPLPIGPTYHIHWSMKQARTIRPNPQGSFHYGTIPVVRRLLLANTVSYVDPETPLKLADWLNIPGVLNFNPIKDTPTPGPAVYGASVIGTALHDFMEIVFQNTEATLQSWHLDGYSVYAVAYGHAANWTSAMRRRYNLVDTVPRHTFQVYPLGWTAVLVSLDNKGMWNLRSAIWSKRYLGQQLYIRIWNNEHSCLLRMICL